MAKHRLITNTNESKEGNLLGDESVMFASYGVIGAIVLFGGAGYLLDRWADSAPWFLLVGLATGIALAFFGLVKTVRHSPPRNQ